MRSRTKMDFMCSEFGEKRAAGTSVLPLALRGADEREKLVTSLLVVTERAEHGARHCRTMLLFDAAHLHAEMAGFDDHADALRRDLFLDGVRDLAGQTLLNLQASSKGVHQAGDLAESQNSLVREIGHMGLAEKRQQVVFAKAEELDVLDDDHLVVGHAERGAVQHVV